MVQQAHYEAGKYCKYCCVIGYLGPFWVITNKTLLFSRICDVLVLVELKTKRKKIKNGGVKSEK